MKGQIGMIALLAVVAIVTGVIGVSIVDSITNPIIHPTTATNENMSAVVSDTTYTLDHTCLVDVTGVVVNGSAFTNYTDNGPTRGASQIALGDLGADSGALGYANYTYSCEYGSTSAFRTIAGNIALIALLGVFGLAGMALFMKG